MTKWKTLSIAWKLWKSISQHHKQEPRLTCVYESETENFAFIRVVSLFSLTYIIPDYVSLFIISVMLLHVRTWALHPFLKFNMRKSFFAYIRAIFLLLLKFVVVQFSMTMTTMIMRWEMLAFGASVVKIFFSSLSGFGIFMKSEKSLFHFLIPKAPLCKRNFSYFFSKVGAWDI